MAETESPSREDCPFTLKYLEPYIHNELEAKVRSEFEIHLKNCPVCQGFLTFEKSLTTTLKTLYPLKEPGPNWLKKTWNELENLEEGTLLSLRKIKIFSPFILLALFLLFWVNRVGDKKKGDEMFPRRGENFSTIIDLETFKEILDKELFQYSGRELKVGSPFPLELVWNDYTLIKIQPGGEFKFSRSQFYPLKGDFNFEVARFTDRFSIQYKDWVFSGKNSHFEFSQNPQETLVTVSQGALFGRNLSTNPPPGSLDSAGLIPGDVFKLEPGEPTFEEKGKKPSLEEEKILKELLLPYIQEKILQEWKKR